jgi:hypothetical protein
MIGSLLMMIGTIFILFFAPNVQVLLAGEILCGESSHFQTACESSSFEALTFNQVFHGVFSRHSLLLMHLKSAPLFFGHI